MPESAPESTSESIEDISVKLNSLIQPGFRARLTARGTARAMMWRDGILPEGSPRLGDLLTQELLSYAFGLLRVALKSRSQEMDDKKLRAFELAGESLESVVKNGDVNDEAMGFYRIIAAAAYHLGRFSARAYSLAAPAIKNEKLSIMEKAIGLLILRRLDDLQDFLFIELKNPNRSDEVMADKLGQNGTWFSVEDAMAETVIDNYLKSLAAFLFAIRSNAPDVLAVALERLTDGEKVCFEVELVSSWWIYRITKVLVDDLWMMSLQNLLPVEVGDGSQWPRLRELFVAVLARRRTAELELWPSQLGIVSRIVNVQDDIIASLPTSAGKTRIAELCILRTLSLGQRVIFITPLRSLSAQTENTLKNTFYPLGFDVSSLYGSAGSSSFDLDRLQNRNIVVSTPEKLDFALRNNPDLLNDVGLIVLDEGHMLGVSEREVRYEVLVQRLIQRPDSSTRRIVCLSAMLPSGEEMDDFVGWLRNDEKGESLRSAWRPTRQRFGQIFWNGDRAEYQIQVEDQQAFIRNFVMLQEKIGRYKDKKKFPAQQNDLVLACAWRLVQENLSVLIYCPQKISVGAIVKRLLLAHKNSFLTNLVGFDSTEVQKAISIGREWLGQDHPILKCLLLGVAVHHASLPKPFLREIDILIREKKVPIVVASPTLARGLNISASCVLFQSWHRFNEITQSREVISIEELSNVSGRAGRAYVDSDGQVLGISFNPARDLWAWKSLVAQQNERKLESGLLGLVMHLFRWLNARLGDEKATIDYVINNSNLDWDDPFHDDEATEWKSILSILDIALLSLIGDGDCDASDVAGLLDNILSSSFFRRRLSRRKEEYQRFASAILSSRAEYICSTSSVQQRRGYFFAGVGLSTGIFLDTHAAQLNAALLNADDAIRNGDVDRCIGSVLEIADRVFEAGSFMPYKRPEHWQKILRGWLNGMSMSDLQLIDEDSPSFIEDAVVYRLAWAIEAIRVRSRANEENLFDNNPSPIVAAIETGTLSMPQAVLLQNGLNSRLAAAKALSDYPAIFENSHQMRTWLFSEEIIEATKSDHWPTEELRHAWSDFIKSQQTLNEKTWDIINADIKFTLTGEKIDIKAGDPVFVWQPNADSAMKVFTPEMIEIGELSVKFHKWATRWTVAHIKDEETVHIHYVGPTPN